MQPSNSDQLPQVNNWQPDPAGKRRKIILIGLGIFAALMLVLVIAAALLGGDNKKTGSNKFITSSAQTSVEMADYDKQALSLRYPKSLNLFTDEPLDGGLGWFLSFSPAEGSENYDISILVSTAEPEYQSGEEAVTELLDDGLSVNNIQTTDVIVAGTQGKKTATEFVKDDQAYLIVYSTAHVGDKYVEFTAIYDKKLVDVTDSLDVLLGSIKLK